MRVSVILSTVKEFFDAVVSSTRRFSLKTEKELLSSQLTETRSALEVLVVYPDASETSENQILLIFSR